nr:hypothetical protein [Tanacetum cinerariifolium]
MRSRLPSPSLPPSVSPSPLPSPPPAVVPPPQAHIESVGDDIETLHASLASTMLETMTLHPRVGLLKQHDMVTRDSLRITRGRITWSQLSNICSTGGAAQMDVRDLIEPCEADRMSFVKIEHILAQRVANAIETIAIFEAKTRVARDLMNRVERHEDKVAENASNKRKWKGYHGGSSSQQQIKDQQVIRAHIARVRQNIAIASELVIKLEIVGPSPERETKAPSGKIKD